MLLKLHKWILIRNRFNGGLAVCPKFRTFSESPIEDLDLRTQTFSRMEAAARHLQQLEPNKLSDDWLGVLKRCTASVKFGMPLVRDDGTFATIEAYRAHHSYHKTPCQGGVRISPEVEGTQMEALAVLSTIKGALHEIPFGGAKGGIRIDPAGFTENELRTICRRYILELSRRKLIGSSVDVIGPGMGSGEREMAWMLNAYTELNAHKDMNHRSAITGKHVIHGGIEGTNEATAFGVSVGIKHFLTSNDFCNHFGIPIGTKGKRVVLQGYGRIGSWAHKLLEEMGCRVIGIIERSQGVYSDKGLEYGRLYPHWKETRSFAGIKDYSFMDKESSRELLKQECDILILSALENTITLHNVDNIKAKMLVEAADSPVSSSAYYALVRRNIPVLPDVLISAGGLMGAYIEWLKGRDHGGSRVLDRSVTTHYMISLLKAAGKDANICAIDASPGEKAAVQIAIEDMMVQSCRTVYRYSVKHRMDMRLAAYAIAIRKILEVYKGSGTVYA